MIAFIDQHRGRFGVEPLCAVLPISSSSYYDHKARETDTARQSARWHRDEELKPHIQRVWNENFSVYGELSFITAEDDPAIGTKLGAKYSF